MVSNRNIYSIRIWLPIIILAILISWPADAQARHEHLVYFRDTDNELNIYKIYGRKDGPTMMIVGGIQGDEPGGFLSADTYIDLSLKRGNLIVVPRANFNSILQFRRGSNGDMNRKFGTQERDHPESQIVRILEGLMGESDLLLNLHDGWGFYRPKYESKIANPLRYGQAIIADTEEYVCPRTGQKLLLKKIARKIISEINEQIDNPRYHFHFMNTRTGESDSPYKEQRKSATYYALTQHGIPAFGVETSKNLPTTEMKVLQHNLAINAFMKIFGLELEQPRIYLEKPKLNYLVVAVNNQIPVAIAEGQTLYLTPGDSIEVVHVEANYERGLSVDIQGLGTLNDFRQKFIIDRPTFIMAQKDHIKFGRVPIALHPVLPSGKKPALAAQTKPAKVASPAKPAETKPQLPKPAVTKAATQPKVFTVKTFIIEVNGQKHEVPTGRQLEVVDGDRIKVVDIISEGPPPGQRIVVNFKGYAAKRGRNTGEDRGQVIDSARDLMKRYSISKKEKIYKIVVEQGKEVLARMTIRFNKPSLDYLVLSHNGGPHLRLNNGDSYTISPGDTVQVVDLKTNIPENRGVEVKIKGPVQMKSEPGVLLGFKAKRKKNLTLIVTRGGMTIGKIALKSD